MFRSYIYGYLNEFFVGLWLTGVDLKYYKQQKFIQASNYLKLNGKTRQLFLSSCGILSFFENLIYLLLVTWQLFIVIVYRFLHNNINKIDSSDDIVVYGYGAWNLKTLLLKASIDINRVVFITYPCRNNSIYRDNRVYDLSSDLSIYDIIKSYLYSIRMIFFIKAKYGKRDALFHASNSFEYFLVYLFYLKHPEYKLCFVDLYDRWANMYGALKNTKILIQHGMIADGASFVKKIGSVDVCYVLNEQQKEVLLDLLIDNIRECKTLPSLVLSDSILKDLNGKKSMLIICSHFYFEKEKIIISKIGQETNWNVFIKPHPLDDIEPYVFLAQKYKMNILGKSDFPRVDLAISYASTLALEYQMAGVKVLQYNDPYFEEELKKLIYE